jgi:hypothetical protein
LKADLARHCFRRSKEIGIERSKICVHLEYGVQLPIPSSTQSASRDRLNPQPEAVIRP